MASREQYPVPESLIEACREAFSDGPKNEFDARFTANIAEVIYKRGASIREAIHQGGPERSQEMADVLRLIDISEQANQQ